MSTIVTRSGKGSPLTNTEVDANFTNLNTGKAELSGSTFTGEITANGGIALGDNDKATFGAGDDLQIYHDGSNSYVKDVGAGTLNLQGSTQVLIAGANGTVGVQFVEGAGVNLRHNNALKLATTSTGIDVTGTATMDGLTSSGNVLVGASSASAKLTVGTFGDTARAAQFHGGSILLDGGAASEIIIGDGNVAYMSIQTTDDATAMKIRNFSGSADLVTIERASGNVGIGISSSLEKFTVANTSSGIVGRFTNNTNQTLDLGVISGSGAAGGVYYNNANSGYHAFQTGGTERFRIDSSGNVGIGTTNPAQDFVVAASTNGIGIEIVPGTLNYIQAYNRGTSDYGDLKIDAQTIRFGLDNGAEKVRIDSSGNVGIGTDSPSSYYSTTLVVDAPDEDGITVVSPTTGVGYLMFADGTSGNQRYRGYINYDHADDGMQFATSGLTRMRIDSSGNVLVGGSSAFGADTITLGTGGFAGIRNTSGSCLELRRDGTDGSILDFQKDGTTVGNIGTFGGTTYFASNSHGFLINGTQIEPCNNNGGRLDNTVDVGSSSYRFKDLYLSGTLNGISTTKSASGNRWGVLPEVESNGVMEVGRYLDFHSTDGDTSDYGARLDFNGTDIVSTNAFQMASGIYLGGTGAANKLDDYEEGDYDCTVSCGTSGTISLNGSFNRAGYTKVGRLVTVHGFLVVAAVSSPVGFFNITLPFTPASLPDRAGDSTVCLVLQNIASANITDFVGTINENDARIYVQLGDNTAIQNDSAQQIVANTYIHFSTTYSAA
jgi:hypothetical protein